jgi:predicted DNA-binding protein YlxM (UPF0122 family)
MENVANVEKPPTNVDCSPKDIPIQRLIELRRQNLSLSEIAKVVGCSKTNVHNRLEDIEEFERFSKNTDLAYEVLQNRIYNTINDAVIQKAPLQSRVWAIAVLEDKKRLIRQQATAIIDVDHTISCISDLSAREKILEASYKVLQSKVLSKNQGVGTL